MDLPFATYRAALPIQWRTAPRSDEWPKTLPPAEPPSGRFRGVPAPMVAAWQTSARAGSYLHATHRPVAYEQGRSQVFVRRSGFEDVKDDQKHTSGPAIVTVLTMRAEDG